MKSGTGCYGGLRPKNSLHPSGYAIQQGKKKVKDGPLRGAGQLGLVQTCEMRGGGRESRRLTVFIIVTGQGKKQGSARDLVTSDKPHRVLGKDVSRETPFTGVTKGETSTSGERD